MIKPHLVDLELALTLIVIFVLKQTLIASRTKTIYTKDVKAPIQQLKLALTNTKDYNEEARRNKTIKSKYIRCYEW